MIETPHDTHSENLAPEETLRESVSALSVELTRISAEIQSINSGFQSQLQHAIGELRVQLEKELRTELQREFDAEIERRLARAAEVKLEFERASVQFEALSKEIEKMLDDPTVELSKVMRKKSEQTELKAYLDGLRYSIGG